jgi:hypothetical protein
MYEDSISQSIRLQNKKNMIMIFDYPYCALNIANVNPIANIIFAIF